MAVGGTGVFVAVWVLLSSTVFLLPVAIWIAIRWALLAPVVALEGGRPTAALRRSTSLVRGRWLRTASLVGVSAVLALAAGPLLGVVLIFVTTTPLVLLNLIAGAVYAFALPFVALVTTYVYADARAHGELEPRVDVHELPAEISLS